MFAPFAWSVFSRFPDALPTSAPLQSQHILLQFRNLSANIFSNFAGRGWNLTTVSYFSSTFSRSLAGIAGNPRYSPEVHIFCRYFPEHSKTHEILCE